jgi:hypothetical protein
MPLKYINVNGYLYEIEDQVDVPIVSSKLRNALFEQQTVDHPYFIIKPNYITVSAHYAWDGATGAIKNTPDLIVPSLIHDIGCQAVNLGLLPFKLRHCFDREYYEQALLYGVNPIRALIHYAGISLWGMIPKDEADQKYSKKYEIELKCK